VVGSVVVVVVVVVVCCSLALKNTRNSHLSAHCSGWSCGLLFVSFDGYKELFLNTYCCGSGRGCSLFVLDQPESFREREYMPCLPSLSLLMATRGVSNKSPQGVTWMYAYRGGRNRLCRRCGLEELAMGNDLSKKSMYSYRRCRRRTRCGSCCSSTRFSSCCSGTWFSGCCSSTRFGSCCRTSLFQLASRVSPFQLVHCNVDLQKHAVDLCHTNNQLIHDSDEVIEVSRK